MLKPQFKSFRIFLYVSVFVVVLPGVLAGVIQVLQSTRHVVDQQRQQALYLASSAADGMGNHLKSMITSIAVISHIPFGRDHFASFYQIVKGFSDQIGYHVTLADADGNQFLSTRLAFGTTPPRRIAMDSVNKAVASGRPHVSEIFPGKMAGNYVITVDAPVQTEDGLRVITLSADAAAITSVLFQTTLPKGWILGMIDGQGAFISYSKNPEQHVGKKSPAEFINALSKSEQGIIRNAAIEIFPTLTVFHRVPDTSWSIFISIPESVVYASLVRPFAILAGSLVIVIGLTVLLAFFFFRQMTAAIDKLIVIARDPLGNINESPEINSFTEFDEVAQVLKTVAADQQQLSVAQFISEKRFRQLFEIAQVPLCFVNKDGVLEKFNNQFEKTFGYNHEDVPTLSAWIQLAYPDSNYRQWAIETWDAAVRNARENNADIVPTENRVTCKNQKVLTVLISGTILDDGILSTFYDITERKQAEEKAFQLHEAVVQEKDRLSALVNSISDEIWLANVDGKFTLVNPSGSQEFALDSSGAIDVREFAASLEVLRPDGSPRPIEESPALRALRGEVVRNQEEIIFTPAAGEFRYRQVNSTPIRDPRGNIIGSVSVVRDITDKKQAEDALLKSERKLSLVLENMSEGLMVFDADGNVTYQNPASERIHGFQLREAEHIEYLSLPVDWKGWDEQGRPLNFDEWPVSRVIRGEHFQGQVLRARRDDTGLEFFASYNGCPIHDDNGKIAFAFITIHDITERKQAEAQLKDLLSEKEVLLKEVHHRVKNNLQIILSLISLQSDNLTDERMLWVLGDAGARIRTIALVHEMLYKTENLAQLDFAVYATDLLQYLWRTGSAIDKKVSLNLSLAPLLLPIDLAVNCGLILNELATNALKHAFPNDSAGDVTVVIEHDSATGDVCLIVSDNGIGLPADFDWRQSSSLGLDIVQMLAGQIRASVQTGPCPGPGPARSFESNSM